MGKFIAILGVVTSAIAIIGFSTGKFSLPELFHDENKEVKTFCKLFSYWNVLLKDSKQIDIKEIKAEIQQIDTRGLNEEGRFETAKYLLIDIIDKKSFERGMLVGKTSKILGEIMKCCGITTEDAKKLGYNDNVKQMEAIKRLMELTGVWTSLECS